MRIYSVSFFRSPASAYESERAGAGRGVFFINYVRALVRGFWIVYGPDGYKLEIRHDDRVREFPYWKSMLRMQDAGLLKLIYTGPSISLCGSMALRLDPLWEPATTYLLCRDLDALPTFREKRAVDRWIESGKAIHAMHDSISHGCTLLMGGMVSFNVAKCRNIPRPPYAEMKTHGDDQRWLNTVVAPMYPKDEIVLDDSMALGPKQHPMDKLGSHIGGAFGVQPFVDWVAANPDVCPRLKEIVECES